MSFYFVGLWKILQLGKAIHKLEQLDLAKIDLGSGKRVLVKGGKLDPQYDITVPADLGGQ